LSLAITIVVGTMTGTAQLVAQELELALEADDVSITVLPADGLDETAFVPGEIYLVCTSTYGQGDIPDNARALFDRLESRRPDLRDVRYGVIALGDRTYADTFAFGGQRFDALLSALGAKRIGDVLLHDASSGTLPEDEALHWAVPWLASVRAAWAAGT